ncbi:MAG: hypothetical protein NZ853_01020 [Leptospiraceae bacterium]|nr:hypothetical protein [Leptospiraceae bacterium]MDW7976190.1 DUF2183 domain-containing protein [Leptospiraceae bacterium]
MEKSFQQSDEFQVPAVGRKRIAIYNGSLGQLDRVYVRGQIIDIPVLDTHLDQEWDIFCMLPENLIHRFRAIQDINMAPVRSPRIRIEIIPYEGSEKIAKLIEMPAIATYENFAGDGSGNFELPMKKIKEGLESGRYLVRTYIKGIDSIRQNLADLANLSPQKLFDPRIPVGFGRLRILPKNYEGFVIISDIDKTFLNTKFESRQGLLETLLERIENKKPIPGMDEYYRVIKKYEYPLIFISASPTFFHRVLEGVFKKFQISPDGIYLKKLINPISSISTKIFHILTNLNDYMNQNIEDMLNRSMKFLNATLQSIMEQTGYKLKVLLYMRKMQPTYSKEVLIGDNSESDYLIFTLYQILLSGIIPDEEIVNFLYNLKPKDKEIINRDLAIEIYELVKENHRIHRTINPVKNVFIHKIYNTPNQDEMYKMIEKITHKSTELLEKSNIKLPVVYHNMGELALLSYEKNIIFKKDFLELISYFKKIQPDEFNKIEKKIKDIQ